MKRKVKARLRIMVERAVEEGVAYGVTRAFKHTDTPSREIIEENIDREVMNALEEVIDLGL